MCGICLLILILLILLLLFHPSCFSLKTLDLKHREFSPVVNARAYKLGQKREIQNERISTMYDNLLRALSLYAAPPLSLRLSLAYHWLLQDRIDEAIALVHAITSSPSSLSELNHVLNLQLDYLSAYLDFYNTNGGLAIAREIAAKSVDILFCRFLSIAT